VTITLIFPFGNHDADQRSGGKIAVQRVVKRRQGRARWNASHVTLRALAPPRRVAHLARREHTPGYAANVAPRFIGAIKRTSNREVTRRVFTPG